MQDSRTELSRTGMAIRHAGALGTARRRGSSDEIRSILCAVLKTARRSWRALYTPQSSKAEALQVRRANDPTEPINKSYSNAKEIRRINSGRTLSHSPRPN